MTTARLFVALWPPAAVVSTLMELERPDVAGVRWATPDQFHVTLGFFGDVDVHEIEVMGAALGADLVGAAAPEVRLGPATCRLGRGVLCVPARGAEELAAAVRGALAPWAPGGGWSKDPGEQFSGHLTLARAKGRRVIPGSLCGVALEARWRADEVRLVRSDLGRAGARYTAVSTVPMPRAGAETGVPADPTTDGGPRIPHRTDVRD